MADSYRGVLGMIFLMGLLWLFSENRKAIRWKTVGAALLLQVVLALMVHKVAWFRQIFEWVSGFCGGFGLYQSGFRISLWVLGGKGG